MTLFATGDGNTPLSPDEQDDLIPDLTTKEELNEWERQNILEASEWALDPRNLNRQDPFSEAYVRELHLRMFDQTWKWAGSLPDHGKEHRDSSLPNPRGAAGLAGRCALLGGTSDLRTGRTCCPVSP
jgi:fido (protein-threonine AMPylation protein)